MIAMPLRVVAAALGLALAMPLSAGAQAWWPADTDASLDDDAADASVPLFGAPKLFGTPTPDGGEPGAMLTDPVALASGGSLAASNDDALFGTPVPGLSLDGLGMYGSRDRRGRGALWYRQVAYLSTFCPACLDPVNRLLRIDLLSDFTREPDPETQDEDAL